MDHLVALRNIDDQPATKLHRWEGGEWCTEAYSSGSLFAWSVVGVSSIEELSRCLAAIEEQREWFVVRGRPTSKAKYLRRQYKGDGAHFEPVDRRWLCIDIDGLALPDGACPVATAIQALPDYFHDVTTHWQLSASAGIGAADTINIHLWYWLDRAVCDFSLREWAKAVRAESGAPIDSMLYNPVQPHYTALPIIEGAPDPIGQRSGLRQGERDAVELPESVTNLAAYLEKRRQERKERDRARKESARRARLNPKAPEARKSYCLQALNSACQQIESAPEGDRHRTIYNQSAAVGELLHAGYVDHAIAQAQLEESARIAIGSEGRHGEAVRTVADGLSEGVTNPRDLSHVGALARRQRGDETDKGWLDSHEPITCPNYERGPTGCQRYIDNGSCALECEFMCTEWLKINPPHSGTNRPPRQHWSSNR